MIIGKLKSLNGDYNICWSYTSKRVQEEDYMITNNLKEEIDIYIFLTKGDKVV